MSSTRETRGFPVLVGVCFAWTCHVALAQTETEPPADNVMALRAEHDSHTAEQATQTETTGTAEAPQELRGPKYHDIRFLDDFSYLDGPEGSYQEDLFDPIKWIHLTDDLTLSIGGEFRARLEAETNKGFGSTEPAQDTFFLHRYLWHFDLRYRKLARVFYQGISAYIEDRDLGLLQDHENRWDIQQLFFDVKPLGEDAPLTLRVGRQEFSLGKERLLSPDSWGNARQSFDSAALFYNQEKFDAVLFYAKPVHVNLAEGLNRKPDVYREEADIYGIYTTCKAIPDHPMDLYFIAYRDTGDMTNANGRVGDISLYTFGGRIGGHTGPLDYDGELAGQWGKFAGDTIHAWMAAADAGYTFETCPWTPRLGIGFDYGSGDDDPSDGTHDTFNPLYPDRHAHLGLIDAVGRQNVLATNVNVTFEPLEKVSTRLAWYTFWNDAKRDALYDANGAATRRETTGGSGHDIGNELDLTVKYDIDAHQSVLFGYSHFWGNNFIRSTGPSEDADLIYLQYAFKF